MIIKVFRLNKERNFKDSTLDAFLDAGQGNQMYWLDIEQPDRAGLEVVKRESAT